MGKYVLKADKRHLTALQRGCVSWHSDLFTPSLTAQLHVPPHQLRLQGPIFWPFICTCPSFPCPLFRHCTLLAKVQCLLKVHATQRQKTNNLFQKWAEDPNRHFSKKDIQTAERHMKRRTRSLITREMQMKTTMRCRLTLARTATMKTSTNKRRRGRAGKGTLPVPTAGGNVNW